MARSWTGWKRLPTSNTKGLAMNLMSRLQLPKLQIQFQTNDRFGSIAAAGRAVRSSAGRIRHRLEIHPRAPGIARNVVERRARHVRHLAYARVREQRFARVVAVLVAYQAQLHDRELRGDRTPQDAVVEDGERRGGHALLRGLDISRRNERAYDRRHTGLGSGGDQAGEHVLEFVGGSSKRIQRILDRLRPAFQQAARRDRS